MNLISDVLKDLKKLKNNSKELRKFGITVGAVFLIFACAIFIYKVKFTNLFYVFSGLGCIFALSGLFSPMVLLHIRYVWMGLAFILGWFVSRFILTFVFYIIVAPIGFFSKIMKKDFLDLKKDDSRKSYWRIKENKLQNYEKMS